MVKTDFSVLEQIFKMSDAVEYSRDVTSITLPTDLLSTRFFLRCVCGHLVNQCAKPQRSKLLESIGANLLKDPQYVLKELYCR